MHPLQNGTQTAERPTPKNPLGDPGFFTESGKNGQPSIPGADYFNAQILEFQNLLAAGGVEFDLKQFDHLAQAIAKIAKDAVYDNLVGLIVPDSTVLATRSLAFIADGSSYLVADYPKLMSKVQGTAIMVDQALIDAEPEKYAACYGITPSGLSFTVPNYSLRPHLAVAGSFGVVGSTIEDQIQNITGRIYNRDANEGVNFSAPSQSNAEGALKFGDEITSTVGGNLPNAASNAISFDASRSVRTGSYTEVNSSFLNFYIIHGEVV